MPFLSQMAFSGDFMAMRSTIPGWLGTATWMQKILQCHPSCILSIRENTSWCWVSAGPHLQQNIHVKGLDNGWQWCQTTKSKTSSRAMSVGPALCKTKMQIHSSMGALVLVCAAQPEIPRVIMGLGLGSSVFLLLTPCSAEVPMPLTLPFLLPWECDIELSLCLVSVAASLIV